MGHKMAGKYYLTHKNLIQATIYLVKNLIRAGRPDPNILKSHLTHTCVSVCYIAAKSMV